MKWQPTHNLSKDCVIWQEICLGILQEIQHSAMENKDKMTLGVGDEPMPFFYGRIVGAACGR